MLPHPLRPQSLSQGLANSRPRLAAAPGQAWAAAAAAQDAPLAALVGDDAPCSAPAPAAAGRIDVILGPMFAGKTSELLRRIHAHEARTRCFLGCAAPSQVAGASTAGRMRGRRRASAW